MGEPVCRRCGDRAAGLLTVAEVDHGEPGPAVAEVALCGRHLLDVAVAAGFEPPRPTSEYVVGEVRRGV